MLSFRLLLLSVLPPQVEGEGIYFGEVCLRLARAIPGWDGSQKDNTTLYHNINSQILTLAEKGVVIAEFDKSGNANRYRRAAFLD